MTLLESFWRSWDNSLSESLLYYCIFLLCYKRYILFWGVRVEGGVRGLAFHFYDNNNIIIKTIFNEEAPVT